MEWDGMGWEGGVCFGDVRHARVERVEPLSM